MFIFLPIILTLLPHFWIVNSSVHLRRSRKSPFWDSLLHDVEEDKDKKLLLDEDIHSKVMTNPKFVKSGRSRKLNEEYGSDINGSSNHGWLGASISLSKNGDTLAVGGYANALVYSSTSGDWELDNDFTPSVYNLGGYFVVGLSNDGTHLVVGAPNNNEMGLDSGRVYVFKKKSPGSWETHGRELFGTKGDMYGCAVSLSEDGETLAVGSYGGGYVTIYKFSSTTNVYLEHKNIVGSIEDGFGMSVSLSGDAGVLAVGAPFSDDAKGSFRVTDISKMQFVKTLVGTFTEGYFGYSVALSSDGLIAAGGSYGGNYVRIFKYFKDLFNWIQLGIDITSDGPDAFGGAIAISGDGKLIAIGAPLNSRYGAQAGRVKTYKLVEENWLKVDLTAYGSGPYDLCGASVAISSDGKIEALGCPGKDDGGYDTGQIKAYEIPPNTSSGEDEDNDDGITLEDDTIGDGNDFTWQNFGESILGELNFGELGQSLSLTSDGEMMMLGGRVSAFLYSYVGAKWKLNYSFSDHLDTGYGFYRVTISSDGSHVAAGSPNNDVLGPDSGEVKTFENQSGSWVQIGKPLNGGNHGDLFGCQVSFSENGKILAVGAYGGGNAYIYNFAEGTSTYELSKTLKGITSDGFGFSVSLSGNGNTCVVGAPFNMDKKGFIRIYDVANERFTQTFTGTDRNDLFGFSVSIASNGMRVAGGGHGDNYVRVFEHDGVVTWSQLGIDINGYSDAFGTSVSLGADGDLLAVGAPLNALYGSQSGRAYLFEINNGSWEKVGSNINGEVGGDACGSAVSLSSNGHQLAMGCPLKSFEVWQSGQVEVYKVPGYFPESTPTPSETLSSSPSANPSQSPTENPTIAPTITPTLQPAKNSTPQPTPQPSPQPTPQPSQQPSPQPTRTQTKSPTNNSNNGDSSNNDNDSNDSNNDEPPNSNDEASNDGDNLVVGSDDDVPADGEINDEIICRRFQYLKDGLFDFISKLLK